MPTRRPKVIHEDPYFWWEVQSQGGPGPKHPLMELSAKILLLNRSLALSAAGWKITHDTSSRLRRHPVIGVQIWRAMAPCLAFFVPAIPSGGVQVGKILRSSRRFPRPSRSGDPSRRNAMQLNKPTIAI